MNCNMQPIIKSLHFKKVARRNNRECINFKDKTQTL